MYWDQLTSPELDQLDRKTVVILPISATEQHGAHLPLATDRLIGEHFCREINLQLPDQILILPSLCITCSRHHMDFSGTLSLQHATFLQQMKEVLMSVVSHGFKNLLVFNSHGGNQGIGQVLVEEFGQTHPSTQIALVTWWKIALTALLPLNETGKGGAGHAGEFETSLMLHIAPEFVREDKIAPGANSASYSWAEGDMLHAPQVSYYRSMKEMTPNGIFGNPVGATPEKGKLITDVVLSALNTIVSDLGR